MRSIKKSIFVFGAVAIVLLMVSTAIATNALLPRITLNKSALNEVPMDQNEIFVDPDIYLTANQLPSLREAVEQIKDKEIKELIEQIILEIKNTGFVDSDYIQTIAADSASRNYIYKGDQVGIHAGELSGTGPGRAWMPLGLKMAGATGVLFVAFLPHFLFWKCDKDYCKDKPVDIWVGSSDKHITTEHSGFAIGFIGYACERYYVPWDWDVSIEMHGLASFIIIVY